MKIFNENKAQAQDTICLNQDVKKIIQHLDQTGRIIGDDDLIIQELEQAKDILDNLIIGMQDKNTHLVYYSGSARDFLKKESRIKKENIDIVCDNDSDEELMGYIMDLAAAVSQEAQAETAEEVSEITLRRRN